MGPPRSVTGPTVNPPPETAVRAADSCLEPHPLARRASETTSRAIGISFFTALSEVLDCGTKTVADSTSHTVVGVVLRVREGHRPPVLPEHLDDLLRRRTGQRDVTLLEAVQNLVLIGCAEVGKTLLDRSLAIVVGRLDADAIQLCRGVLELRALLFCPTLPRPAQLPRPPTPPGRAHPLTE